MRVTGGTDRFHHTRRAQTRILTQHMPQPLFITALMVISSSNKSQCQSGLITFLMVPPRPLGRVRSQAMWWFHKVGGLH